MSVVEHFGLTADQVNDLLDIHWTEWAEQVPDLVLVPATEQLCEWLRRARPDEADRVLRGLARLAHDHPGGSREAALVLAWLMMPAASLLAHQLRFMSEDIDSHVAAQLWIAIRTFPYTTTGRVAANLKYNLRKKVVKELTPTSSYLPLDESRLVQAERSPDAIEELIDILGDGLKAEAIDQDDFDLLMAVLDAADELEPPAGPGIGVIGDRISAHLGELRGCTARTIRRRIKRSTSALTQLVQEQQSA